jgi:hypothetical protein
MALDAESFDILLAAVQHEFQLVRAMLADGRPSCSPAGRWCARSLKPSTRSPHPEVT